MSGLFVGMFFWKSEEAICEFELDIQQDNNTDSYAKEEARDVWSKFWFLVTRNLNVGGLHGFRTRGSEKISSVNASAAACMHAHASPMPDARCPAGPQDLVLTTIKCP